MSHLICNTCGGSEHYSGFGNAGGVFGAYSICECGAVLELCPDLDGMTDDEEEKTRARARKITEGKARPSGGVTP